MFVDENGMPLSRARIDKLFESDYEIMIASTIDPGLSLELSSGHCDGCGEVVSYNGKTPPCIYKVVTNNDRYIAICCNCARQLSSSISLAFGE